MEIDEILSRGVGEIIQKDSLAEKLKSGKKLRIKFGIDPTAPDLHLGHTVPLRKLKQFQDLGHQVILIIGDFTATIGDPSARKEARKILSKAEVKNNMKTYLKQVGKILDLQKTEVHQNSEWYDKKEPFFLLELSSNVSLQQIMARDDFRKRVMGKQDVSMLEGIYPMLQGYDSVAVNADLEIGGTDQKFNLLMGRKIQRAYGKEEQDIMLLPLLVGIDGVRKMSKSFDNYIAINDEPVTMYGKVMSIPDDLIVSYYELVTDITSGGLEVIKKELNPPAGGGKNPRDVKAELAKLIVEMYHSAEAAEEAQAEFEKVFKNKEIPSEIPEFTIEDMSAQWTILKILNKAMEDLSNSEIRRLIEGGAIYIGDEKITDPQKTIRLQDGMVIKVGKRRFIKVKYKKQ